MSPPQQLRASGALLSPTDRWIFRIEPLARALGAEPRTRPAWVWLPCMQMGGFTEQMPESTGAMHPALELGDLLLRSEMKCMVYKARCSIPDGFPGCHVSAASLGPFLRGACPPLASLGTRGAGTNGDALSPPAPAHRAPQAIQSYAASDAPEAADALLRAVIAQDTLPAFRALAAKLAPKHRPLQFKVTAETTLNARFNVLVLASETQNHASHSAFCAIAPILKAGADIVHVVTVVQHQGDAQKALRTLATYGGDVNAFLEVYRHVELAEGRPFAERAVRRGRSARLRFSIRSSYCAPAALPSLLCAQRRGALPPRLGRRRSPPSTTRTSW